MFLIEPVEINLLTMLGLMGTAFGMGMLYEGINSFKKFAKEIADRAGS